VAGIFKRKVVEAGVVNCREAAYLNQAFHPTHDGFAARPGELIVLGRAAPGQHALGEPKADR